VSVCVCVFVHLYINVATASSSYALHLITVAKWAGRNRVVTGLKHLENFSLGLGRCKFLSLYQLKSRTHFINTAQLQHNNSKTNTHTHTLNILSSI